MKEIAGYYVGTVRDPKYYGTEERENDIKKGAKLVEKGGRIKVMWPRKVRE